MTGGWAPRGARCAARVRPGRRRDGGGAGQSGSASIEFVALLPLLLGCAVFAFQAGAAAWTLSATSEAVREAARAASQGRDARTAAENALPGALRVDQITVGGPGHTVTLWVKVPSLLPGVHLTVDRKAVMP